MEETQQPFTPELLARHGAWLRRLARALSRDPSHADDLVQDTWETMLRRPADRPHSERGWLARVLSNRLKNQRRDERRRRARDLTAAGPADAAHTASPEEAVAQVELSRQVVALVAALPASLQQVIHLRYFEDLEPLEIARRLNAPPGTIRWRLKTALDQLRAGLDHQHGGDRRRWMVLMLAAAANRSAPPVARVAAVAAGGAAVVGLVALLACTTGRFGETPVIAGDFAALPRRVVPPPSLPPPPPALVAAVPPADCPEARALETEIELRSRELASRIPHQDEFASSQPNPVARRRFAPVLERVLQARGNCPYSFECRGAICIVQILVPEGERVWDHCPAKVDEPTSNFVPRDYLSNTFSPSSVGNETPVTDPVSGQTFRRHDFRFRLARLDGEPVPWEGRPAGVRLAPGRHLRRPPLPDQRSPACRADVARLGERLDALHGRVDQLTPSPEAFRSSEDNPALIPEVRRAIARITGLPEAPFPRPLTCRGAICALSIQLEDQDAAWYARLVAEGRHDDVFERVDRAIRAPEGLRVYLRVRPPAERGRIRPFRVMCALADRAQVAALFERCEREHPATGALTLQLQVPGPEQPGAGPRAVTITDAGPLSQAPLGRCVVAGLANAAAQVEVPVTRYGMVRTVVLHFPGARTLWPAGRDPCGR